MTSENNHSSVQGTNGNKNDAIETKLVHLGEKAPLLELEAVYMMSVNVDSPKFKDFVKCDEQAEIVATEYLQELGFELK